MQAANIRCANDLALYEKLIQNRDVKRDITTKLQQVSMKMTKNELLKNDNLEKIDCVYRRFSG